MYAATTKDEGNAADGLFSEACYGLMMSSTGELSLSSFIPTEDEQ
jgi:hypothetical protein